MFGESEGECVDLRGQSIDENTTREPIASSDVISADNEQENVISLVEFVKHPLPVITTRFVGPDLSDFQDDKHMSTFSAAEQDRIEDEICKALVCLRRNEIVRQDIKPKDVLYSRQERKAVLIDFGLGRMERDCDTRADCGTPCFLPPEVSILARRSYGWDMWAAGILLLFVRKHIGGDLKNWNLKVDSLGDFTEHNKWLKVINRHRRSLPERWRIRAMLEPKPSE